MALDAANARLIGARVFRKGGDRLENLTAAARDAFMQEPKPLPGIFTSIDEWLPPVAGTDNENRVRLGDRGARANQPNS
jgi:hypothetical protein